MNTITVNTAKSYEVIVGCNELKNLGAHSARVHKPCTAVIISDSNVWPLHGSAAVSSLESAGFDVCQYIFPAGEVSKNVNTYIDILNFLAANQVTRSDMIVALGGGVVGDMAGFAAATYLRGIRYIQVPTSLLAMVDSSVGGKTAVDLAVGKNLVGAFYQPDLVVCDIATLSTLPETVFRDGCAEVIKYGILYDPTLFSHLQANGLEFDKEYVISRCVELKRDVVCVDEYDTGARQMLNLGHTLGHAIEAQSNYKITHGQAVAIGMNLIAKASENNKICSSHCSKEIQNMITRFALPTSTNFSAQQLYTCALSDKKRFADTLNLIVPMEIGHCKIHKINTNDLLSFIEAGL